MTKKLEIYKCEVCGNIVELVHAGQGELVCCGQLMVRQDEKTDEENLTEKHRPIIESGENAEVKIGSVPHPMEGKHYIEWVEIISGENICRHEFSPGENPEAVFCLTNPKYARAYCNIHGLWKS
jgi:superoxide reductase